MDSTGIIDFASQLSNSPCTDYFLPGTCGLSFTLANDSFLSVGFFVQSGFLLGSNATVYSKIHAISLRYGWDTSYYDAILGDKHLNEVPGQHGMIGFGVDVSNHLWMQVGLRP